MCVEDPQECTALQWVGNAFETGDHRTSALLSIPTLGVS